MLCTCGCSNAEGARFCRQCGTALPGAAAVQVRRVLSGRRLAAVVVLAAVAAAGYWWSGRPPGPYRPDNGGLFPIAVDGKHGFMDRDGAHVIPPQFDEALEFSEGLAAVRVGNKYGFVDAKGQLVITPQFDSVNAFRYGRAVVRQAQGVGFIGENGTFIHGPTLMWMHDFSGDLAPVRTAAGQSGFVTRAGEILFAGRFENVGGFSEGLAPASSAGRWGYISADGEWRVQPQFEYATLFSEGLAAVRVGGKYGYVDADGRFVINPQFISADAFSGGVARVADESDRWRFVDRAGRFPCNATFVALGNIQEGLAPARVDHEAHWGFVDAGCQMVLQPGFDAAGAFQNGLARVWVLGREGYISASGAFVLDPFPGMTVAEAREKAKADAEAEVLRVRRALEQRIAAGTAGVWTGGLNGARDAVLTLEWTGATAAGVMTAGPWRQTMTGTIGPDGEVTLVGTSVTAINESARGEYFLDTIVLRLSDDSTQMVGTFSDAGGSRGRAAFRR